MKKFILISVLFSIFAIGFAFLSVIQNKEPDPRHIEWNAYSKAIRDLSKNYDKRKFFFHSDEKSFDLYLAHFLMSFNDAYSRGNCTQNIQYNYREYNLIFFKLDAQKKLENYCDYDIGRLISEGNKYLKKSKEFDYNTLNAMYFYYNAYIKATDEYLDTDYHYIPSIVEQSRESFTKFRKIRNQLSDSYINVVNDTPFGQFDAEATQ